MAWLPALMALLLSVVALVAAAVSTTTAARRIGLASVAVVGALSVAIALWQASASNERIAELVRRDRTTELTAEVQTLREQLATVKESVRFRSLGNGLADRLAADLRGYGARKVVVSCAPNDIEAYRYATEIAAALKAAGWDARGPEPTAIFGDLRSVAINLYDRSGSDTAKILTGALDKFAIPYQVRVPPGGTTPDDGVVELFVSPKPGPTENSPSAAAGQAHTAPGAR